MTNDKRPPNPAPETLAAQALGWTDPTTGAVIPAIHPATTYVRAGPASAAAATRPTYTRPGNPTYLPTEALLTRLENGVDAALFASGMAAATTIFQALAPGDHVIAPRSMYWSLRSWLTGYAADWGLAVDLVPNGDLAALAATLRPGCTKLVWIETPSNPLWQISDIAACVDLVHRTGAHDGGARVAVDNTVATPVLTRPLDLGADLVMHSATKYLNGHSDVLAGALITARRDGLWQRIGRLRGGQGAVPGPFEAWLLLRGMRTLYPRVRTSCSNALVVASSLQGHPAVHQVLYPGLPHHPDHAVAVRQMQGGFGGMLSIRVRGGAAAARAVVARTRLWHAATSLGGVESLIEHRADLEGPDSGVPDDLLRLSAGIEAAEDLLADLDQALQRA